jgi:hypothetical protein
MVSIMFRGSAATFVGLDEAMLYAPSDERAEHHRPAKIEIVPSVSGADPATLQAGTAAFRNGLKEANRIPRRDSARRVQRDSWRDARALRVGGDSLRRDALSSRPAGSSHRPFGR